MNDIDHLPPGVIEALARAIAKLPRDESEDPFDEADAWRELDAE